VRELGADRAAVDVPELVDELAQPEARLDRRVAAAGEELGVEVGLREPEVVEPHDLRDRPLHQAERIDLRRQVTPVGVDLDHARDGALLGGAAGLRGRHDDRTARPAQLGALRQFLDEGPVGDLTRLAADAREILPPLRLDRGRSARNCS